MYNSLKLTLYTQEDCGYCKILKKKFNCKIVPIHIERKRDNNFKLKIFKPLDFSKNETIETITLSLNSILEKMIIKNPGQWIWTHNRWK